MYFCCLNVYVYTYKPLSKLALDQKVCEAAHADIVTWTITLSYLMLHALNMKFQVS